MNAPRKLSLDGSDTSDLMYLRTFRDAFDIRAQLKSSQNIRLAEMLIENRAIIDPDTLANPETKLKAVLKQWNS